MEFVFDFERQADVPLYRSLSNAIKTAISDGRLRPGEKIPSVRVLCELADVSRNTAHQCYQSLISEGYVEAVQGKGVFVSTSLAASAARQPSIRGSRSTVPSGGTVAHTPMIETLFRLEENILAHQKTARALKHQMPSLEDLPLQQLKRALAKHTRLSDPRLLAYSGDPFGHPVLREAIANYVLRARAIQCTADQVVVTSRPSQQMLDLFCRLFISPGDWVAVEHPGYSQPRQILAVHNAHILPIPVDDNGLQVEALAALTQAIKLVYITPSHQDPTGAILSLQRRKQLVAWAIENNAIIWEDDVDNEYRYGSEPIPALYALDTNHHVIYQSTFWRTLCPLIRLGYAILPANRTKEIVHLAKYLLDRDLPIIEQLALADLINEGHFERHVRAMRKKFTARRQVAIHGLTVKLPELLNICRNTAGLHLRATFDPAVSPELIVRCARDSGLAISATSAYYIGSSPANEFLIQFAHMEEEQLRRQIETFASQLKSQIRSQSHVSVLPVAMNPACLPSV